MNFKKTIQKYGLKIVIALSMALILYKVFAESLLIEGFVEHDPQIYVLTRTSGRPNFFEACRESIKNQTYGEWYHITSTDDYESYKYAIKDTRRSQVVKVKKGKKTKEINCPYNLYNNELIAKVPVGAWMCFLDDDSRLKDRDSFMRLVKGIKEARKNGKELVISKAEGTVHHKPECWGMSEEEIIKRMEDPKQDWWFSKIDTAHICIKKTSKLQPWGFKCMGDIHFFWQNIQHGYKIHYNDAVIIEGNYTGKWGGGKRNDIKK